MEIRINWDHKRCKHAIERMWLRGVSVEEVKEAIIKGKKIKQIETSLIEAFYRFFSVVYDERILKNIKIIKIYPVTVKLW
jgi:DNA-directed RNA polymerase beta' subunit